MPSWKYQIQRVGLVAGLPSGRARMGNPAFLEAENFDAAYIAVKHVLAGLRNGGPNHEYRLVSLSTHDYSGEDCGGVFMFETLGEMQTRIDAGKKAKERIENPPAPAGQTDDVERFAKIPDLKQ